MAESKNDGFQSKKPEDSDFQQQRLKAWQPLLTPVWVIITFLLVGIIFIVIGVVVLQASNSVVEITVRYDNMTIQNASNPRLQVRLDIPADMKPPIFLYYKLTNFYQNHRRYVKSRSDAQLKGESGSLDSCDPLVTWSNGTTSRNLYPCGLIANSFFNDTFHTATVLRDGQAPAPMPWTGQGIAWESDRRAKFVVNEAWLADDRHTTVGPGGQLPRVDNEDFIVWMRTAGLPTFKKLNKRILNETLKAGDALVVDVMSWFPVAEFEGQKALVLSTTSWLGGKNEFLGYAYIVVGALSVALALAFLIKHKVSPRELGQMKYFNLPCAPKK